MSVVSRLACVAVLATCTLAQVPSSAGQIACNSRWVYVLQDHVLFQLDAETLEIARRVELPLEAPIAEVVEELEGVEVAEVEEIRPIGEAERVAMGRAVELGLEWLRRHQDEDGRWDADEFMKHDRDGAKSTGPGAAVNDVGVSGLAMLAFLGSGSTLRSGPYREELKRATIWLRGQQSAESGLIGSNATPAFIYNHAIATLALVEAYGLSDYKTLENTAQSALNYLERHRNPYAVWRYQPRDNDNDTSVTCWCALAYRAGQDFGLEVNPNALALVLSWLDQVTDPATGRTGYSKRGERSSRRAGTAGRFPPEKGEAMTASGLLCRYLAGQHPDAEPVMHKQAELLLAKPPVWNPSGGDVDAYYWYFGALAAYQAGGRVWDTWQRHLADAVVTSQRSDGGALGSWDPVGPWGEDGGRVYTTAMLTMTLQAGHRYARVVK